ncbi:hypothetical protein IDM40_16770 [Nocardiopsis sp. HNM0947]|uniref:Uncharacterized protein n=1 Tax=Nocardiopsis coralli TaxID=2772213 RepID=A0ABR9P930_9ACTN|nr:hypothetical protein [Nocardiopsis coralli]
MFPPEAVGSTQSLSAVPPSGRGDNRPLFRDEVPEDAGADTAQFDVQSMDDYDGYDDYADEGHDRYDSGARKRKALLISGFVVLLIAASGGAYFIASSGSVPGSDAQAATVGHEDDDPDPLDPEALFPESVSLGTDDYDGDFDRVAVDDTEECADGAHGEYGEVLGGNDCRQLVRASYLNEDDGRAVTIGVAAMPSEEQAGTALDEQDLVAAQWFAGLAGDEGTPAEGLGHAGGFGNSATWGRYVLFSLGTDGAEAEDGTEDAEELRSVSDGFLEELHTSISEERS